MTGVPSLHEIRLESRLCLRVGKGRYFGRGGVDELLEGLFQRVGVLTIRGEGIWGGGWGTWGTGWFFGSSSWWGDEGAGVGGFD